MSKKPSTLEKLLKQDRDQNRDKYPESPDALDQEILAYAKQKAPVKTEARSPFLVWAPVMATASMAFVAVLVLFSQPQPDVMDFATQKTPSLSVEVSSKETYASESRSEDADGLLSGKSLSRSKALQPTPALPEEAASLSVGSVSADSVADDLEEITVSMDAKMDASAAEYSVSKESVKKKEVYKREMQAEPALAAPVLAEPRIRSIESKGSLRVLESGSNVRFRASGNKPGWLLEIGERTSLRLNYGEQQLEFLTEEPEINSVTQTSTYQLRNDNHQLTILVTLKPCTDTMSGQNFSAQVTITLDERKLMGCGEAVQ